MKRPKLSSTLTVFLVAGVPAWAGISNSRNSHMYTQLVQYFMFPCSSCASKSVCVCVNRPKNLDLGGHSQYAQSFLVP